MIAKVKEKEKAIALRRKGLSYREILRQVPVAKSTLSLWLKDVGLTKLQIQKLSMRKVAAALRGAETRRRQKIEMRRTIKEKAKKDIKNISRRDLWLIGLTLYWAEGTKEKEYGRSQMLQFGNSDPNMIRLYSSWLFDILGVSKDNVYFEIYIHKSHKARIEQVKQFWGSSVGVDPARLSRIYYKKHNPQTKRKNIGDTYHGMLRVSVRASSHLTRKVQGWIDGVVEHFPPKGARG